jgi:acyl-coenzyme A thioesterase PaaI-like protein
MGEEKAKSPKRERRKVRTKRGFREYTYLGCPLTKDRTAWCFRLCVPGADGKGRCGRVAPHGLQGRTQLAIADHPRKRRAAHLTKLERMYLGSPFTEPYDPGVRVQSGESELVVPIRNEFRLPSGDLADSVCVRLLHDAATLAVNAVVEDRLVSTVRFTAHLTRHAVSGQLIARGLVVAEAAGRYEAECVLADAEGTELGRGEGTFEPGATRLSPEIGYA